MKTTIKNLILSAVLVVGGASCVDLDTARMTEKRT